jgi:hypothetical protein
MTLSDLRAEKARKYRELANNRNSAEYEMWFLKYYPQQQGSREPTVPSGRFQRPRWSPEGAQSLRPLPSKKQLSLKASHEDSDMKSVEKEDKDSEETSLEKAVKEQSFIESFIGSPKQSKKSSKKSERTSVVSPIVTFLRKTQKNKTGEFLF